MAQTYLGASLLLRLQNTYKSPSKFNRERRKKKLMILFIIIVLAIAILLFDLKAGIYKSESRLVNMKTIDEKIKIKTAVV
jgi:hypothetical protein